jgi:Flp pilus assembly protein TadG
MIAAAARFARVHQMVRAMRKDQSGVAAIEFAMIVPIMVMLFFGSVEFSQAMTVDRRVAQIASSTADLVAQYDTISNAQVDNIFLTVTALMEPYPTGTLKIWVANLQRVNANTPTVTWSRPHNGASAPGTGPYGGTVPAGILDNPTTGGTSCVILAEVVYDFTPAVAYFLTSSVTLSERFYLKPRRSTCVGNS